jgi:cytochrome c oxidase assembly protein subunit 15
VSPNTLRSTLRVAALLVLIVIAASAFIRLSIAGLDCAAWPACYAHRSVPAAAEASRPAVEDSLPITVARGIHRIVATAVGILLVGIVVAGWNTFRGGTAKGVALAVLALTAALAWLGRHTPSELPAVVLGNLLGGMLLFGLLWWLSGGAAKPSGTPGTPVLIVALALLALQMGLGGMVSARRALLSCTTLPSCNDASWFAQAGGGLFDPLVRNADVAAGGAALVLAHRFGALAIALIVGGIAVRAMRAAGRAAGVANGLIALLAAQLLLGVSLALIARPLPLAVLHNFGAALLLATLVSLLWPKERSGS